MSRLYKALLTYQVIILLVCYLVFSFIFWDSNPGNWEQRDRLSTGLIWTTLQLVNLIIYSEFRND